MKLKQINYEEAEQLWNATRSMDQIQNIVIGYNNAVNDIQTKLDEKKDRKKLIAKHIKSFTPEFVDAFNKWLPGETQIPAMIKTNNRIIELAEKFKAEIVRLNILNDKQNFRIAKLENQIPIIHRGDTDWQMQCVKNGDELNLHSCTGIGIDHVKVEKL